MIYQILQEGFYHQNKTLITIRNCNAYFHARECLRGICSSHAGLGKKMRPNIDSFNRCIDYLRVSITDWCNLRCLYCRPRGRLQKLKHEEILTYEEIIRLCHVGIDLGIRKIRITGGEPLLRRNVLYLCRQLTGIKKLESLTVTTNGVLLHHFADELKKAGVDRVNVSLDTLDPMKYQKITGKNFFNKVWQGIEKALSVGFYPVKINVVVMRNINGQEIEELAKLTFKYPLHVRFIELMPFLEGNGAGNPEFMSSDEIMRCLERVGDINPVSAMNVNGPAVHFQFAGAPGKIGIISPISHHFCPTCNRLRLTADGKLRACLFSDRETDIKTALRSGASAKELESIFKQAIESKPEKHTLTGHKIAENHCHRPMVAIGG